MNAALLGQICGQASLSLRVWYIFGFVGHSNTIVCVSMNICAAEDNGLCVIGDKSIETSIYAESERDKEADRGTD